MSKGMMSLLLPICFGLGACGESETPSKQPTELQDQMKADADLMLDIGRAGTELERRLSEAVRAQDGIVIIHDPATGRHMSQVLSPNTPWVLSCGVGISIVFGSSVSGYEVAPATMLKSALPTIRLTKATVPRWRPGWVSASTQFSRKLRLNSLEPVVCETRTKAACDSLAASLVA
jgi:hypothetical protein